MFSTVQLLPLVQLYFDIGHLLVRLVVHLNVDGHLLPTDVALLGDLQRGRHRAGGAAQHAKGLAVRHGSRHLKWINLLVQHVPYLTGLSSL